MKLFGATWTVLTAIWHVLGESVHCASLRDLGNAALNRTDGLLLWLPALLLLAPLACAAHGLAGSWPVRLFYAVVGAVLSFVAVMVLALIHPLCGQTPA